MSKTTPSLSVVISADVGAELLRSKLESLRDQTLDPRAFEILIMDARGDEGRQLARSFERALPLRVERPPSPGRAAARNHATLAARGEVVLFFDDEGVADPGLLEVHVRSHRAAPAVTHAVLGATAVAPAQATEPLAHFVTHVEGFPVSYASLQDGAPLDFTSFWGARCSCKRGFLVEGGLFDPSLHDGCEDVELGYRLAERGLDLRYYAGAITRRTGPMLLEAELARRRRHGAARRALTDRGGAEALRRWAGIAASEDLWAKVKDVHRQLVRSALELDRLARLRSAAGLPMEPWDVALLHRGYWTALRIAHAQGAVTGEAK
ncbi:glycosyltransferase [Anaeromyxobacter oryzisoli]|uniref:glycosyltransferase n=1 Tax=Anaeromyxobacter oryzisoli TaxID=2925408 RepID=UPI001F569321|nr:glycosyltransferase family A protein [Anaeromyxobacter sp. SG63]